LRKGAWVARTIAAIALAAALSALADVSVADPLTDLTNQLSAAGRLLTQSEWCQLALLAMASRAANEQTRMALNEMSQPSIEEQACVAVCRTIPDLLFEPGMSKAQKLEVMKIAEANGCIR
jgi:hypothetical protein